MIHPRIVYEGAGLHCPPQKTDSPQQMRTFPALHCGRHRLDLSAPRIMAIINATPDSFSGDGHSHNLDSALRAADAALEAGAHVLDVGGESTRPGAQPVSEAEEIDRVVPLIERLADAPVPVSIDTFKPAVMRAALAAGATLVNDICACAQPGAIEAVAATDAAVCLMHMQGEPRTMQHNPQYENDDVTAAVRAFLQQRAEALRAAGVAPERIVLDPGFGFGKTVAHNFTLLARLGELCALGYPVLAGLSRKSMFTELTRGAPPQERVLASTVATVLAAARGARIVRVHDVAAAREALAVWQMTESAAAPDCDAPAHKAK